MKAFVAAIMTGLFVAIVDVAMGNGFTWDFIPAAIGAFIAIYLIDHRVFQKVPEK
ncbi:hypothetical protein [Paenisporosarcina cavernae]|uniref:hypothetical protein n=1 Tax=Paenisporosarcina cavernae TaxID=2320858 RepID=UPI0013C46C05|nr:hypothetical protein [Paenisporosarcina cavernae]